MKNSKITIIGTGAIGTSLATVLKKNHCSNLIFYGIDNGELDDLKRGYNKKYFNDFKLPKFNTTNNLAFSLKDTKYIILAIPSTFVEQVLNQIINLINCPVLIINLSKGFDLQKKQPLHQTIEQLSSKSTLFRGVVSIIGPSYAEEILHQKLTVVKAVSRQPKLSNEVIKLLSNDNFIVKKETDIIGANVGAMYKNIIAIAIGMCDSLKMGMNAKGALITYALKEINIFNEFCGGKQSTIFDLCGLGDLYITSSSKLSRNYSFGFNYLKSTSIKTFKTVEGLNALKVIYQLNQKEQLALPFVNILYKILFENQPLNHQVWKMIFN